MIIKINNIDRTNFIDWRSLSFENVITQEPDRCVFDLKVKAKEFKPEEGQEILILEGMEKLFGGIITDIEEVAKGKVLYYRISGLDFQKALDKRLVVEAYQNMKVEDIIADFVSKYSVGFTTLNVSCDIVLNYVAFNYEPPSRCLKRLADLTGYDWYADYDKDIHFFSKETNSAPFSLEDDNKTYFFNSLSIKRDNSQIRNTIYIRGGIYKGDWFVEHLNADGIQTTFPCSYKYSDISIKVNSVDQSVGIDNITDPATKDCLYNFAEKVVKFRNNNKPAAGADVEIAGYPYLPVIIKAKDWAAVTERKLVEGGTGEYEFRVIDKRIKTKEQARERARAELIAYARTISEGSFETFKSGLRSGQLLKIKSIIRGIDEEFIINRVRAQAVGPNRLKFRISIVTTKTMNLIEFLQNLLEKEVKDIEIDPNEILDKVDAIYEAITIGELVEIAIHKKVDETVTVEETIAAPVLFIPPYKWAPYPLPARFRWNLSEWS